MNNEMMESTTPMDDILGVLDGWIQNPKSVTPEAVNSLKEQLMELKGVVDSEDETESEDESYGTMKKKENGENGTDGSGLLITIGRAMKK